MDIKNILREYINVAIICTSKDDIKKIINSIISLGIEFKKFNTKERNNVYEKYFVEYPENNIILLKSKLDNDNSVELYSTCRLDFNINDYGTKYYTIDYTEYKRDEKLKRLLN